MAVISERVRALAPYVPGLSIEETAERHGLDRVIKMASNENPLGASPLAQQAVRENAGLIFRYPRGGNPRLAAAIAARYNVPAGCVALGNGSDEIIDLLLRIAAEPGDNVLCMRPCFGIYSVQARICGLELRQRPLREDFSFDLDGLLALADRSSRLCFLTTPDNPSGYCPPAEAVRDFAAALGRKAPDCLLVIDEAYMDFAPDEAASSLLAGGARPGNAAFLRTFSKSYGLAGMRVGYAVMPEELADAFWRARLPFSINLLAEAAALAALEDDAFRQATLAQVGRGRECLSGGLEALGCKVWPSSANFLLFRAPDGISAPAVHEQLLRKGVIIRRLASYGLPEHLRVSVGNDGENMAFLSAMGEILEARDVRTCGG